MSEYHAVHSPSGAKKRFACPGSLAMEEGIVDPGNEYSDEGTAAHALASMCLKEGTHPAAYVGRILAVENGVYVDFPRIPGSTVREFTVDTDFAAKVNVYVQSVRKFAEGNELQVEQQVPVGHVSGEEGATGTADAIVILADYSELQAHDLKFGMGVEVSAVENEQGYYYLSGALEMNRATFDAIGELPQRYRFVIHQPRIGHFSEWSCTLDELMAWQAKARAAEDLARACVATKAEWIGVADSYALKPGDHCRQAFCKARGTCPALAQFVQKVVQCDFEVLVADKPADTAARVPTDLKELGLKFAVLDIVSDWVKQVRARAEGALFEHHNSEEVQKALGLKLVQGKKGNRSWDDVAAVEALLKKLRYKTEVIYDLSVKSPPALEKLAVIKPVHMEKLAEHITQREGQPSVAPITDKRPALNLTPKGDAFEVEEESDLC